MNPPLLKLEFVQGPRDGESIEYKPGSVITLGRIVRGNKIAIKDKGISTKHLRIDSVSEKWIIQDLGSSNGTILNSETLDPDIPVNLSHGDVIKLGEITSIVVSFVDGEAPALEHKLPPRPRRNNKRYPGMDPVPIEPVQEKPTRKGRSSKQEEAEVAKRATRASRSDTVEVEVKRRVGRPQKNEKKVEEKEEEEEEEEEVPEEKSRVHRGKKTASVENLGLNSVKLEIEDTPKVVEILGMNRARRGKKIENVKCEDTCLDEKGPSRATRSRKKEIGGDSFRELDMVLNQARKSRAKRKQVEQKTTESVVEMEARNNDVEDDKEDNEDQNSCNERSDEITKRVEQVEIELRESSLGKDELNRRVQDKIDEERVSKSKEGIDGGCDEEKIEQETGNKNVEIELREITLGEEEMNCSVREDDERENVEDTIDKERDRKSEEEKVEKETSDKNVEKVQVDIKKMTAREWFESVDVQMVKQITEETEKLIEPMRSKALRVQKYIAEQLEAKRREGLI